MHLLSGEWSCIQVSLFRVSGGDQLTLLLTVWVTVVPLDLGQILLLLRLSWGLRRILQRCSKLGYVASDIIHSGITLWDGSVGRNRCDRLGAIFTQIDRETDAGRLCHVVSWSSKSNNRYTHSILLGPDICRHSPLLLTGSPTGSTSITIHLLFLLLHFPLLVPPVGLGCDSWVEGR